MVTGIGSSTYLLDPTSPVNVKIEVIFSGLNCDPTWVGIRVPPERLRMMGRHSGSTFVNVAVMILVDRQRPMRCSEIIARAVASGKLYSRGKTPEKSLHAAISRSIARDPYSPFKKVGKGLFSYRWDTPDEELQEHEPH
ncbi:MAG: winged helix-turn-helix domain-containing protein [Salinarimonas sp.]|nr:winged helix-turn-helix domain-containing protein [Salinarimonas sp.]